MVAVGELVQAYLTGGHGEDSVYMDTKTGKYYFQRWEDCVLDDTLYHIYSWGWRPAAMVVRALAHIVDECTVQVADGEYEGCWYCDQGLLEQRLKGYDEEQEAVIGDE